jgi:hypothetical protein
MFDSDTLHSPDEFVQSIRNYQSMIHRRIEALTLAERLQHPVDYNGAKYKLHNLTHGGIVRTYCEVA